MSVIKPDGRRRGRPKSQSSASEPTLQTVERALKLMQSLALSERATLSEISTNLDLPPATVHRLLATLQSQGFATVDPDTQEWMIGIEAFRVGSTFLKQTSLTEVGRPIMRRLMEETGETANLAVRDQFDVVFVGQIETPNPIRAFFAPGTRTAMHASGTGKAILASLPNKLLERWLSSASLTQFTANTRSSEDTLRADLEQIKSRGWSFDEEERYDGMSCIGAAIYDRNGEACAGISVSGPSVRFSTAEISRLGAAVVEAASEITELHGGFAPRNPNS